MVLTLLFAAVGGGAATLICGLSPTLSWWWMPLIWCGGYFAVALVYILALIGALLLMPQGDPSPRRRRITHRLIRTALSWVLRTIGYRIRLCGADKLPISPFLLVCNHLSAFDPLCTMAVLGRDMVFVAKPSVFKIPVIGTLMRRVGFMPIDRENARNAVATIKQAAHCIADVDLSVGIYPEGTRSKSGDPLPFHAGSFKIASIAKCPVVVAAIRYEKRPLGKQVCLRIADVMDTDYVTTHNTAAMADRAVAAITAE